MKTDYAEAVDLLLKPRSASVSSREKYFVDMRSAWAEHKDAKKAFEKLPKRNKKSPEGNLLKKLSQNPNDFLGALSVLGSGLYLVRYGRIRTIYSVFPKVSHVF